MVNYVDFVVNGNFVELFLMFDIEVVWIIVFIDCEINEKIGIVVKYYGLYIV